MRVGAATSFKGDRVPESMPFPEPIRRLPSTRLGEATVFVHDAPHTQVQFIEAPPDRPVTVPTHTHDVEWGVVVEGQIRMDLGGRVEVHPAGTQHHIPSGLPHSFTFAPGTMSIHYFVEKRVTLPSPSAAGRP